MMNPCSLHQDRPSQGQCALSARLCCESCLEEVDGVKVAREYLDLLQEGQWQTLEEGEHEDQLRLTQRALWQQMGVPSFVQTQYFIDVERDAIESLSTLTADKRFL